MGSLKARTRADLIGRLEGELPAAGFHPVLVTPDRTDGAGEAGNRKGAYLLALHLPHAVNLKTPKRSSLSIGPGWYVYAGSAYGPGGLNARLRRHMLRVKAEHWHIDRLTTRADDMVALAVPGGQECRLVAALLRRRQFAIAVRGFGSTDCRQCEGHLLTAPAACGAE